MKKLLFYSSFLSVILFVSCNNENKKGSQASEDTAGVKKGNEVMLDTCKPVYDPINIKVCTSSGSANYIIDPLDAKRMMAAFRNLYPLTIHPKLKSEYWVPGCVIEALSTFFNTNNKYDGAWITFGCENSASPNTNIFFVPSTLVVSSGFHKPEWADVLKINFPIGCNAAAFFSSDPDEPKAVSFRNVYRKENTSVPVELLSRRVWIDSCVINALNAIIKAYATNPIPLDGIFVYSAVYDKAPSPPPVGYQGIKQSTVVLVPGYSCQGSDQHFPAWDITLKLYNLFSEKQKDAKGVRVSAINHGELCPNACNPADN